MQHGVEMPATFPAYGGDLGAAGLTYSMQMVLGCRLTFDERLDASTLRQATRLLLDAEPLLGCWFQETGRAGLWTRCEDDVLGRGFSEAHTDDSDTDGAAFHASPFDSRGPRLAVRLLHTTANDVVCVKVDHYIADGWSTKEVAYRLAETYSRLLDDPNYAPAPNLERLPNHDDVWAAMSVEEQAAANDRPGFVSATWKMKLPAGRGKGFEERMVRIEPELVSAARTYGCEFDATLSDMLLTALMRSLARTCPPSKAFAVSVSADSRRFAPSRELERICVLASPQTVRIPYEATDDFGKALAREVEAIRPWKMCHWGIGIMHGRRGMSPRTFRGVMRVGYAMMNLLGTSLPIYMNIGELAEERLRFGEAVPEDAYVLGAIGKIPGYGWTLSRYRGAVTLWQGVYEEIMDPALVQRLFEGVHDELTQAVAG